MEQEGDHRARIFSESEPTDQPLVHRTEFWRRISASLLNFYAGRWLFSLLPLLDLRRSGPHPPTRFVCRRSASRANEELHTSCSPAVAGFELEASPYCEVDRAGARSCSCFAWRHLGLL